MIIDSFDSPSGNLLKNEDYSFISDLHCPLVGKWNKCKCWPHVPDGICISHYLKAKESDEQESDELARACDDATAELELSGSILRQPSAIPEQEWFNLAGTGGFRGHGEPKRTRRSARKNS